MKGVPLVGVGPCDTVKLREPPKASATAAPRKDGRQHQGNDLGDGKSAEDATMDDPQPSPTSRVPGIGMQFND